MFFTFSNKSCCNLSFKNTLRLLLTLINSCQQFAMRSKLALKTYVTDCLVYTNVKCLCLEVNELFWEFSFCRLLIKCKSRYVVD